MSLAFERIFFFQTTKLSIGFEIQISNCMD